MLEHVLDLRCAVERQLRVALVQRAYDRQRVAPAIEEVGVAERDVACAHARQALDVAQDGLGLHDADAPVVDGGDRAMPAAMHAPMAGLHVPDQPLLPIERQTGVALESRQQLARRRVEAAALEVDDRPFRGRDGQARSRQLIDPGRERRFVLACDRARGELTLYEVAADRGIEPVEADRHPGVLPAHSARSAERQAHGGMHRHREANRLCPLQGAWIPRLDTEIQAADLVAGAAQRGRRRGDVQRLVAQLVGRDQKDTHR